MQLKLRHLLLFILACILLIFSGLPGAALLALASSLQMTLLIHNLELSRRSQLGVLKLFLISLPLFFFWGGVHSFTLIYLRESQYLFFIMSFMVSLILTFLLCLQTVFSFLFLAKNNFAVISTLQDSFDNIKNHRNDFLKLTGVLFIFSFVPWLSSDWKLVFAVTATHLYLQRPQLKSAFARF